MLVQASIIEFGVASISVTPHRSMKLESYRTLGRLIYSIACLSWPIKTYDLQGKGRDTRREEPVITRCAPVLYAVISPVAVWLGSRSFFRSVCGLAMMQGVARCIKASIFLPKRIDQFPGLGKLILHTLLCDH